jgi:hypothetical protein
LKRPATEFVMWSLQAVAGSFTPQDWWVSPSFGDPGFLDFIARLRHWGTLGLPLAAACLIGLRLTESFKAYRPLLVYDLLALFVGWAALLEIVVNHYWGSARHHLFFSVPLVVLVLGWGATRGFGALRDANAAPLALTAAWFGFQFITCARDLALDVELPFSDTKAAAARLAPNAHLVADTMTYQQAYMLWRPDIVMRGGDDGGRRLGYVVNDTLWHMSVPAPPLVKMECEEAPDRTYYSGPRGNLGPLAGCLHLVRAATAQSEQLRPDERFDLSTVDCGCIAGR